MLAGCTGKATRKRKVVIMVAGIQSPPTTHNATTPFFFSYPQKMHERICRRRMAHGMAQDETQGGVMI